MADGSFWYNMRIESLALQGFRNYDFVEAEFDQRCNVIYGENAQGKTNLLEAMVYLSCGRSPRTRGDRELIAFGAEEASLRGQVFSRDRDFQLEVQLFRGRRRKISVNKVPAKSGGELSQVLRTVFFCPEDLYLIRAGAAERRRFLDQSLCQLRPRYAAALAEYSRLHEHKTRILRDSEEKPDLLKALPEFNLRMCQCGAVVIGYRAQYCRRPDEYAAQAHGECSGGREELRLQYKTVSTVTDPEAGDQAVFEQLLEHQKGHAQAEVAARQCLTGPHKDDIEVFLGGRSAKQFASQGQTRTAALAMKLAEREIHRNVTGEYPVLLLDDVLSELDPKRQEYVLNRIAGGQVFITCCEDDRLSSLLDGKVFHVREGRIL